jgi:tetratricopeptide (TPR) repeat protein
MRKLSYNAVCGIVVSCLAAGYILSFFFVRRFRPKEFVKEFSAINSLYEKGDYRRAIDAYYGLAARYRIQCMSLCYNLANAYYKTGDLGRAILFYRKAQKLAPRDKEVADNLRSAQAKAGVLIAAPRSSPTRGVGRRIVKLFSLFEGVAASLTFRWLLIISVIVTLFFGRKRRGFVRLCVALAILFYLSLGATLYKAYVQRSYRQAVVLRTSSPVKVRPGDNQPTLRELKEGTTVRLQSNRNGWCKIGMDSGKTGWIRERDIGEI